jgi:hypothetical protein
MQLNIEKNLVFILPSIRFSIFVYNIKKMIRKSSNRKRFERKLTQFFRFKLSKRMRKVLKKGKLSVSKLIKLVG